MEWISVEHDLPDKTGVFVDIYLKSTQNPTYGERQTDVLFDGGVFKYRNRWTCVYVSHWKPLPEPPSELITSPLRRG